MFCKKSNVLVITNNQRFCISKNRISTIIFDNVFVPKVTALNLELGISTDNAFLSTERQWGSSLV